MLSLGESTQCGSRVQTPLRLWGIYSSGISSCPWRAALARRCSLSITWSLANICQTKIFASALQQWWLHRDQRKLCYLCYFCSAWPISQLDCISHSTFCCDRIPVQPMIHLTSRVCHGMLHHAGNRLCESWEWGCLRHGGGFPNRTVSAFRELIFAENTKFIYFRRNGSLGEVILEQMVSLGTLVKRERFSLQCFCVLVVSKGIK